METLKNILCLIGIVIIGIAFIAGLFPPDPPKKKKRRKYPKCDCRDSNDCSKWCYAKHAFNKDSQDGKI